MAYPIEHLGPIGEAAKIVQAITQAPIAIAAQSALAAASLVVQGHFDVETLGGVRPTSLFLLTQAVSGERKSSCDDLIMEPIYQYERDQSASWKLRLSEYEVLKRVHETGISDIVKKLGDRGAKGERAAPLLELEPAPDLPRRPERLVSEPTFEGLTKLLAIGQPSLGVFSDEGGQFLNGYAMSQDQRGKTLAAFNFLWQGKPIKRTRAGDGQETLYGRRVALHLMVQPGIAESFVQDRVVRDIGFLARALVCRPASTIGTRLHSDLEVDRAPLEKFHRLLTAALERALPMDSGSGALTPKVLTLAPEAKAALVKYSDRVELAQREGGPLENVRPDASKSAEQAVRIAGVLTAIEDLGSDQISGPNMTRGIEIAQFYLVEALRLYEAQGHSQEIKDAETLRQWLFDGQADSDVTVRYIQQKGPHKLRSGQKIRQLLRILETNGWIVRLRPGDEGVATTTAETYRLVRPRDEE
ncbi:YfjI family protein [Poseidonocella sp. HB161398]|uniref:YfjI family protein n=1 Tax=Poseidonocella sp. HB161398 TaxID=2320855 RepID=UPI00148755EE|nr:YfjI family protein [Poseidonocella sp. HB161398]